MTKINSDKINQLATEIIKACIGHKPSEIMTAITMVSASFMLDAMKVGDPVEQEEYIATFAHTLRLALSQDQKGATLQ